MKTIERCDICERVLSIEGEKLCKMHGITWTFGYYNGGWGSRQDIPSFSGEVCDSCYQEFKSMTEKFNKRLLFELKGSNKQKISVVK